MTYRRFCRVTCSSNISTECRLVRKRHSQVMAVICLRSLQSLSGTTLSKREWTIHLRKMPHASSMTCKTHLKTPFLAHFQAIKKAVSRLDSSLTKSNASICVRKRLKVLDKHKLLGKDLQVNSNSSLPISTRSPSSLKTKNPSSLSKIATQRNHPSSQVSQS